MASSKTLLLSGYRVLDLSRILVGAHCSMQLADLGASVIKVEQPGKGDETRQWGPPFRKALGSDKRDSTYYMSLNRNKRSIAVDLKRAEGREIVTTLAKQSDVLIQNFIPSKISDFGLDYESLKIINPQLIYAQVTGYPIESEWAEKAAFDLTIQAMSGLMHITGDPDGVPQKVGWAVTDVLTSQQLFGGIMAAILSFERTGGKYKGQGQLVQVSLLEATIYALNYVVSSWLNGKIDYRRQGNSHPMIAPYSVYKTKDSQFLVIGVATDAQFIKLCKMLQKEYHLEQRFKSNRERCQHSAALHNILQDDFQKIEMDQLISLLTEHGIPVSQINSIRQLFETPQVKAMQLTSQIDQRMYEGPALKFPKFPVKLSEHGHAEMENPPLLGQHSDVILNELGYSNERIEYLRREKVIE